MLKVAKKTEEKDFHIIKDKSWGYGGQNHLMSLMIQFWCEEKAYDRTPRKGSYSNYKIIDIDKKKQKFCMKCVDQIKQYKNRIAVQKKLASQRAS